MTALYEDRWRKAEMRKTPPSGEEPGEGRSSMYEVLRSWLEVSVSISEVGRMEERSWRGWCLERGSLEKRRFWPWHLRMMGEPTARKASEAWYLIMAWRMS